jgi:hypothetical protein
MTKNDFWYWFEQYMPALERLISTDSGDYTEYNALSAKLSEFNEVLVPEITMEKELYVLIISCDGNQEGIPAVEELTEGVREFPNWKIVKYRQPGSMEFIPVDGHEVKRDTIWLDWEKTPGGKYNLTFFRKWNSSKRLYQTGAMLHLDHAIGEYNAMTRVGGIEFKKLGLFQSVDGLRTLDDLKAEMELTVVTWNK